MTNSSRLCPDVELASDASKPMRERCSLVDRRDSSRVPLTLEIAVPVLLRSDDGLARGLARNISEGGMLVEVDDFPPIGSLVDVTIAGVRGSADAPDSLTLSGEVRHHLAWQYAGDRNAVRVMKGIGIRFADGGPPLDRPPESWTWSIGETVH